MSRFGGPTARTAAPPVPIQKLYRSRRYEGAGGDRKLAAATIPTQLDGTDLRLGIVAARLTEYAGRGEFEACMDELRKLGVVDEDVTKISVPGALEIPFALQKLAGTGEYDALIALGAVIRGETYHFELVSNESGAGITRISLDYGIPIANGVLTTENDEQCEERIDMKGRDCARCAVEMANLAKEFVSEEDFEEEQED